MMLQTFQRIDGLDAPPPTDPTYLAVGVFDGVHRGHQALLKQMISEAREVGARAAALTFYPHPVTVIQEVSGRIYLQTLEERVAALAELGLDMVIVHPFNETVRQIRARAFVEQLQQALDVRQFWGGHFSLGYQREGDADFLREMGQERGFTVREFSDLDHWQGERVSSSRIRQALQDGDLETATTCLGRPYSVSGTVVRGRQLGKTIGFPTANLDVWAQQVLPANGVYAALALYGADRYTAPTNIGVRPTTDGTSLTVEAFLLDFSGDLYGETLTLSFFERIRDEQRFSGVDALVAQIERDVAQVKDILGA